MAEFFNRWREGLSRTSKMAFGRVATVFGASEITPDTWDDLEGLLVQADLGIDSALEIISALKDVVKSQGLTRASELQAYLKQELRNRLVAPPAMDLVNKPTVIMMVGVNGSGKTTTTAKLGKQYQAQNKQVVFAAADTFRAAAVDQLQEWGGRLNIPVVAGAPESDPGAVAFNAIQAGVSRQADIVLIDTAGRLHTRFNLMEELKKVHRVVGKALSGAPHHVWLVLDATTGQNALHQARAFKEAVAVTGVILAKLDSSARGGMAFAIQRELKLPVLYAGLGEKPEDLIPFDPDAFIDGILS